MYVYKQDTRMISLDFRVNRFSSDVSSEVGIVVAPRGGHFSANTACIRFFASMHFQVVGEVIASEELLMTMGAFEFSSARVFSNMTLPVGLVGELEAAFVTHERLLSLVASHMSVQQGLP